MSDAPNCKHCGHPMTLVDVDGEVHQKYRCLSTECSLRLERLLNAAENWCGSYLEVQKSPEEVPRALGRHQYNKAALQDALDAYPREENDE